MALNFKIVEALFFQNSATKPFFIPENCIRKLLIPFVNTPHQLVPESIVETGAFKLNQL